MDIKDLELTEYDFKLIINALDHLPNKSLPNEMLGQLMDAFVKPPNSQAEMELKRKRDIESKQAEAKREAMTEDIKILQGKLLMLKRYLMQQDALKQTEEILKK